MKQAIMNNNNFNILNPYQNQDVSAYYVSIIAEGLEKCGYKIKWIIDANEINAGESVLIVSVYDYYRVKRKKPYQIFLWIQGIWPEESYMRNKSKLRRYIISFIEKQAIQKADFLFMVSNAMKAHYERKYHLKLYNDYIMPCFNSTLTTQKFEKSRYEKNVFVYAGGLQPWQCVNKMVCLYKELEKSEMALELRFFTSATEEAKNLLKNCGIKNYTVKYLKQDDLDKELLKAKFGFVLREDEPVNNVSTPTKISTYLSQGVIPIITDAIYDFSTKSKDMKYCICLDSKSSVKKWAYDIRKWILNVEINIEELQCEYQGLFNTYYCGKFHSERIAEKLRKYSDDRK